MSNGRGVKVFAEDREAVLKPGMFAQVNVIAARKPTAILVPTAAIVQQGQTSRVFIVQNGKAAGKTVKVGIQQGTTGATFAQDTLGIKDPQIFADQPEMFAALRAGQIDAAITDTSITLAEEKATEGKTPKLFRESFIVETEVLA